MTHPAAVDAWSTAALRPRAAAEPARRRRGAREGVAHGVTLARLVVTAALALLANGALAQDACFKEDVEPSTALTGKLEERQLDKSFLRQFPAVSRSFYILELDRPICLEGSFSGTTLKDMRSVHITSMDKTLIQQFRASGGRRVSVRFLNLFEEHTAHHRRPIVGIVESVTRLPAKRSTR